MRSCKKSKKFLSLSLSLTMVLSILQFHVSATDISNNNNISQKVKTQFNGTSINPSKRPKLDKSTSKSKMDSKLQELTGKKGLAKGKTKQTLKDEMKSLKQFIPAGKYVEDAGKTALDDLVYVYIVTKTSDGLKAVEPYIFKVDNEDAKNKMLTAWVEVGKLDQLELLDAVAEVQIVTGPKVNVDSEGDQFHKANSVRALANGSTGKGIKVGVISDGVDHLSDSISKGALNSQVTVLSNTQGGDEGTAMLEIVHALAPDASLYFHDSGSNVIAFNEAVDDLVAAGCNVIVDDVEWLLEPYFENGAVASHIKDVVNTKGIVYVSSAGNSGQSHFIGRYYNDGSNYNDFSSGTSAAKSMYMNVKPGETVYVVLQWDDPFNNSSNDYDLFLLNTADSSELESSELLQDGTGEKPLEFIQYTNDTTAAIDAEIDVLNYKGLAVPKTLDLYIYGNNYADNVVSQKSIFGHPAVPEVIAAGAVEVSSPSVIAPYSSQGPVPRIDGTTIQKPDIAGAAGVSVTGSGGFPSKFSGTSAAAPHIAAVAALLWAAKPSMANTDVKNLILNNAADLGSAGYDNVFGYGKADAYNSFMKIPKKPNAAITSDEIAYKDFNVQLDGSSSSVGSGSSLTYNWQLVSKPAGSQTSLINSTTAKPYFVADALGDYKLSLSVNDSIESSPIVYKTIKVKDISSTTDDIDLSARSLSTSLSFSTSSINKPVALTDGWFITADNTNSVKIMSAFTGFVGKQYQLSASPSAIDYDFSKKLIVASLANTNSIAVIDVTSGSISYINTPYSYKAITLGKNNTAFALTGTSSDYVSIIDFSQKQVLNTVQVSSDSFSLMAYSKLKNMLYLGEAGSSPSSLASFSFDETNNQLTLKQNIYDMGSNGKDLSISPDENSLAFSCGGGNTDNGYVILDIDSSDLTKTFGDWNSGAYPTSSGFTSDSKYVVISNGSELKVFDAKNHFLAKTIKRNSSTGDSVQFSKGGKIIYDFYSGKVDCFKSDTDSFQSTDPINQPILQASNNLIAYKGFKVGFDGSGVLSGSGLSLSYKWSFVAKPAGSLASLVNDSTAAPYLVPDAVGTYTVKLVVNNGFSDVDGGTYSVKVKDENSTSDDFDISGLTMPVKTNLGVDVATKPVALSDGWIITADDTNKVKLLNVFTGVIGKQYQLSTTPTGLDFDYEKKLIIASLRNTNKVAVIDTVQNNISYINTDQRYDGIVLGKNNLAFAVSKGWPTSYISAIDLNGKKTLSTLPVSGEQFGSIAYNKINNNLYLGEVDMSPSSLAMYSFDESSNQFTQIQLIDNLGSNGSDAAVSPDGKHAAFTVGGGNGGNYTVFDIDGSNLANKFGEWNTGAYPTAANFTLDSKYVALSIGRQVEIFDIQNHSLLNTLDASADSSSSVVFSRGGKFVFSLGSGKLTCYSSGVTQSVPKGDFDFDGKVTILELASESRNYKAKSSSIDTWNPELDLNSDGVVDIFDLVLLSKNIH